MKLLVDSGSTKADWIAINDSGTILFTTQTAGLNPEILKEDQILERLNETFELKQNKEKVSHIYFYGAGCGSDRMKIYLSKVLKSYFANSTEIAIHEDTYAAAYATAHNREKSIVCILGTGSNCSYFDGTHLHQKVQSLGYIVMDDCSGNQLGRRLIREYYFNKMPSNLASVFESEYDLDADVIKQHLYKEQNPNAYLATFARFLIENKQDPFCQKIIFEAIEDLINYYITQFDNCKEIPIHFVGSIAFNTKEELKTVFEKHELTLGNVIQKPIDGLIQYHLLYE
ncbi:MAG: BadF/BadG/BcrA/BcrD ATPase family protein [Flavobacterium sp.]